MSWYWIALIIAVGYVGVIYFMICILHAGTVADETMQKLFDKKRGAK